MVSYISIILLQLLFDVCPLRIPSDVVSRIPTESKHQSPTAAAPFRIPPEVYFCFPLQRPKENVIFLWMLLIYSHRDQTSLYSSYLIAYSCKSQHPSPTCNRQVVQKILYFSHCAKTSNFPAPYKMLYCLNMKPNHSQATGLDLGMDFLVSNIVFV